MASITRKSSARTTRILASCFPGGTGFTGHWASTSRKRRSPSASPAIRSRTTTTCETPCSCPFASNAITGAGRMELRSNDRPQRRDNARPTWPSEGSRSDAAEREGSLRFYDLAVHLEQRIDEEIDRAAGGRGIDHQVAAFRQLETIGRVMAEIIAGEFWILPRFTDINGHPAFVGKKFRPTMVAFDCALVLIRRNGCADSKTRRDADAARQRYEVGVKIGAVAGARITRVNRVAAAPTSA